MTQGSQNSVDGIWTAYNLDNNGCNPSWRKRFCIFLNQCDWLWGLPTPIFEGYHGSFSGIKRLGREVDHLPKSRAEAKNGRSYNFTPLVCLQSVNITIKV